MNLTPKWPFGNAVDPAIYATRTDWPKISIVTPSYKDFEFIKSNLILKIMPMQNRSVYMAKKVKLQKSILKTFHVTNLYENFYN